MKKNISYYSKSFREGSDEAMQNPLKILDNIVWPERNGQIVATPSKNTKKEKLSKNKKKMSASKIADAEKEKELSMAPGISSHSDEPLE